MQMRLCRVKLGVVSSIYGDFGEELGGEARTHNFPRTGIYKRILVQVPVYAWFYKSENFCAYAKSSFFIDFYK